MPRSNHTALQAKGNAIVSVFSRIASPVHGVGHGNHHIESRVSAYEPALPDILEVSDAPAVR
jgi:hypothetical protein